MERVEDGVTAVLGNFSDLIIGAGDSGKLSYLRDEIIRLGFFVSGVCLGRPQIAAVLQLFLILRNEFTETVP